MAQLLGDRFLPEQAVSMRRRVRARVSDLREPIRSRREQLVPGPDVIGMVEENVSNVRSRFVSRTSLIDRIRDRGQGEEGQEGSGTGDQSGGSSQMV